MDWSMQKDGKDGEVTIRLRGDCDLYSAPAFAKAVLEGVNNGWREIRLDCGELVYLDSTGVGALIRIVQALRARGGRIRCRGLSGTPRKVLEMSNILPLLNEERN